MLKLCYLHRFFAIFAFFHLQQKTNIVHSQSFPELGPVRFSDQGGAGSILPYSSTGKAAGGRGGHVDPNVLNTQPKSNSSSSSGQGPRFNPAWIVRQSGPVFHHVFTNMSVSGGGGGGVGGGGGGKGGGGGGGRLMDPPNRSSLWREGVQGAAVNFKDNHLNCGAQYMPIFSSDVEDMSCGVCGDSSIGLADHVMGGRYVGLVPTVSRTYKAGQVVKVKFLLNDTIIPGVDRVRFFLCPLLPGWGDVSWDCLGEGGALRVVGWGDTYLPSTRGVHGVWLRLPRGLSCRRCVLQWRWQSSQLISRRVCLRQPWLRNCYRPIEYVNCADVTIRAPLRPSSSSPSLTSSPWTQLLLFSGLIT